MLYPKLLTSNIKHLCVQELCHVNPAEEEKIALVLENSL